MGPVGVSSAAVWLVVVCASCSAMQVDLATLLRNRHRQQQIAPDKRARPNAAGGNNPCPDPEKPFPCKSSDECISLQFVCDHSVDCKDGYDEDGDVCTAKKRPPIEDIEYFLSKERSWILPSMFGGKDEGKVAHALTVAQNLDDFRRRLGLSSRDVKNFAAGLQAVASGNIDNLEAMGMPPNAWNEVSFIFDLLLKSGFGNERL